MRKYRVVAIGFAVLMATGVVARSQNTPAPPAGMPWWFTQNIPDKARAGFWEAYQGILGPHTAIPPKYQALMSLAISSQIPCNYCIYGWTKSAERAGATKEEIQQAVAIGGLIRFGSSILQGDQVDFAKFKATVDVPPK